LVQHDRVALRQSSQSRADLLWSPFECGRHLACARRLFFLNEMPVDELAQTNIKHISGFRNAGRAHASSPVESVRARRSSNDRFFRALESCVFCSTVSPLVHARVQRCPNRINSLELAASVQIIMALAWSGGQIAMNVSHLSSPNPVHKSLVPMLHTWARCLSWTVLLSALLAVLFALVLDGCSRI